MYADSFQDGQNWVQGFIGNLYFLSYFVSSISKVPYYVRLFSQASVLGSSLFIRACDIADAFIIFVSGLISLELLSAA